MRHELLQKPRSSRGLPRKPLTIAIARVVGQSRVPARLRRLDILPCPCGSLVFREPIRAPGCVGGQAVVSAARRPCVIQMR